MQVQFPQMTDRAADFGAKLRAARERRGITLRQIANTTKISIAALEALERNDISRLPGGIFSRAFVRAYALEVGLDPESAIQEFIAQFPHDSVTAGHPKSDRIEDREAIESDRRVASTFLWLLVVSVPIAGAVLYLNTSVRREATANGSARVAVSPRDEIAGAAPTSGVNGHAASQSPARSFEVRSATGDLQPPPPPKSERRATETPAAETRPAVPAVPVAPAASAAPAEATAPANLLTIGLSVRRPVWVSATVDGQKAIDQLLATGEQRTIQVRREMVLTAGDAAALTLTLNGSRARPLGKPGEVVSARFTLANFKDYLQTR